MAIRWKLLVLMLGVAAVPVLLTSWLDIRGLSKLGAQLAEQSGQALSDHARSSIESLADDYARILNRDTQLVEVLLRLQKREAERLLAGALEPDRPVYFEDAFNVGDRSLELAMRPDRYFRVGDDGERVPIPVSLKEQVFHLGPGVGMADVAAAARRLAPLSDFYAEAHRHHGDIIYWQYVALENGLNSTFPGHGGYPIDFDMRTRPWYVQQARTRAFSWSLPLRDVSSRLALIGATLPLVDGAGRFAGVTGIDVHLTGILQSLRLPDHLARTSHVLMTFTLRPPAGEAPQVVVIARQDYAEGGGSWQDVPSMEPFATDRPADDARLLGDMRARRSGFLRTSYHGEDVFCVYRAVEATAAGYLVFLVPVSAVVRPAMDAADYALQSTDRQIERLVPVVLTLLASVAAVAFVSSRSVSGPVKRLATAVDDIAAGDFSVRLDIRTGDELETLGRAFNDMVPQLRRHAQMLESLALAREVQQHLLPAAPPVIAGLDLAGFSLYCDQTGGDYYDFIDLRGAGHCAVGVVVGDVSGHGIPSALVMATVRALLHGSADRLMTPPQVLRHLNGQLVQDAHAGRFMTLFYLLVDTECRRFTWASAGHDPAIRYDPIADEFTELGGHDIPLGIDREWHYEHAGADAWRGHDVIVLGTDGIWETRSPAGEPFGKQRLRDIIRSSAQHPATIICEHIVSTLAAFRQAEAQRDDVTAVVLRVVEPAAGV